MVKKRSAPTHQGLSARLAVASGCFSHFAQFMPRVIPSGARNRCGRVARFSAVRASLPHRSLPFASLRVGMTSDPAAHVPEQLVDRQHPLLAARSSENGVIPTADLDRREDLVAYFQPSEGAEVEEDAFVGGSCEASGLPRRLVERGEIL